jgi:hypothetical protein
MMRFRHWPAVTLLVACASLCWAGGDERYTNSNYCFSVPMLHLGSQTPSQDGAGVTFSREKDCAEAPLGTCDKISVYAQYAVDGEQHRSTWFMELESVYIESGWHLDGRNVLQVDGNKWHTSILSKIDAGRRVNAVIYQLLWAEGTSPVIYGINAVFAAESESEIRPSITTVVRGFTHMTVCK